MHPISYLHVKAKSCFDDVSTKTKKLQRTSENIIYLASQQYIFLFGSISKWQM